MIKIYTLMRRNPELSHAEYVDYFKTVHSRLCKDLLPGMRSYVFNYRVDVEGHPGMTNADYDGVVEQTFDTLEDMYAATQGAAFSVPERIASSRRLMDMERTELLVTEVYEVQL